MAELIPAATAGLPVLGICNGFQILCEAHLLPGALTRNAGLHFINRDVRITIESNQTRWTAGYRAADVITVVLKSGEGAYVADQETLADLAASGRIVARYTDGSPNGSADDIAGIASADGNVVGLMPHPEHAIDALTGPGTGGLAFFSSILGSAAIADTAAGRAVSR
jgi:phosphoribosylformylglycinamidine synthase subunit PurQ / glutaminase